MPSPSALAISPRRSRPEAPRATALCMTLWMVCSLLAGPVSGSTTDEFLREEWSRILINDTAAGYVHVLTRVLDDGLISTWTETHFKLGRMGQSVTMHSEQSQIEDTQGLVVRMAARSEMPGLKETTAVVRGDVLEISVDDQVSVRTFTEDWDTGCRGTEYWRQEFESWIQDAQEGDEFVSKIFDLELGKPTVVTQHLVQRGASLHEVGSEIDLLPGMPQTMQVRPDGTVERLKMSLIGMQFSTELCTREQALDAMLNGGDMAPEVFENTLLRPDRPLPRPRALQRVLFRLRAKDPAIPMPEFSSPRQTVIEQTPGEVLLEIRCVLPGGQAASADSTQTREHLSANSTIQSDDPQVVALADRLAGDADDPWDVALRLERGVYEYIDKKSFGVAFASASEVCRNRSGDCSEHAVLLAAVLRAKQLPSRVAMGLIYVGGIFGGHAWTEVWIDGGWVALDATLGLGKVDAAHIRFAVSSLDGIGMGGEMFSALMALANLEIWVLETESDGVTQRYGEEADRAFDVDGSRLTSHVYGLSLDAPPGFGWIDQTPHWASGLVARAESLHGGRLDLMARAVGYDFESEDLAGGEAGWSLKLSRQVEGRPALIGFNETWTLRVLDGDTVFRVDLHGAGGADDDDALESLMSIVESFSFHR
jgi:hypothetical protein